MSLLRINFLHLTVSEIYPGQDFIGQGHCSKVKSRSHHDVAHLHPLTNVPTKYQLPTPYSFRDIARTRFYRSRSLRARSKVKSRSHHDVAHLHLLMNVPTKYQLPTPYGFRDIARTRFSNSRLLRQGQIKVRLWFLRYRPDKLFPAARPSGHHG